MAIKKKYIFGIIICSILLCFSVMLIPLITGKDGFAFQLILALFSLWMAWGIYRGLRRIFYKPKQSKKLTFQGVEYNTVPTPLRKVALDFFNPIKMRFDTMRSIFIVGALGIYSCLVGPRLMICFWVALSVLVIVKLGVLIQTLRFVKKQNELRRVVNDVLEDNDANYDVTVDMINADGATSDQIIRPVRERVSVGGFFDDYAQNLLSFTTAQRYILAINHYISAVYGDSHYEFFLSDQGNVYMDAIEGLTAIGANEYANILRKAAEKFEGLEHPVCDLEDRSANINFLCVDFEDEDKAPYELDEDGKKIESMTMTYIRNHASEFIFQQPNIC